MKHRIIRISEYHRIKLFLLLIVSSSMFTVNAQNVSDDNKVYMTVSEKAKFNGDYYKWLAENINYPPDAKEKKQEGTVYVQFIIEQDGSISHAVIIRGIMGAKSLENEAVRVVTSMPKWTPGKQDGKPVRVQYMLPIKFKLSD
jgi:TonB family protein